MDDGLWVCSVPPAIWLEVRCAARNCLHLRPARRHTRRRRRFQPEWARIITGEDEGVFGWVALNYLVGAFNSSALTTALGGRQAVPGHERGRTVGVLDLGGSSLEVAFELEASTAGAQQLAKDAGAAPVCRPAGAAVLCTACGQVHRGLFCGQPPSHACMLVVLHVDAPSHPRPCCPACALLQ